MKDDGGIYFLKIDINCLLILFALNYIYKQDYYVLLGLTLHCPVTVTFPVFVLVSFTFTTSWRVVMLNLICQPTFNFTRTQIKLLCKQELPCRGFLAIRLEKSQLN